MNFIEKILSNFSPAEKQKILVIENRFETLELFKKALSTKYEILIAQDKENGLTKARLAKPSLIVLNSKLHKEGTLSLCTDLRNLEETKNIPILMIAEKADDENLNDFYKYKVEAIITEPITKDQILMEVKFALNTGR